MTEHDPNNPRCKCPYCHLRKYSMEYAEVFEEPTREEVCMFHDRQRDYYLTKDQRMKLYRKVNRKYIQMTRAEIVAEGLDILRSSPRVKGYVKDVEIAMLMGHVVLSEPEDLAPVVQDGQGR